MLLGIISPDHYEDIIHIQNELFIHKLNHEKPLRQEHFVPIQNSSNTQDKKGREEDRVK